MAEVRSTFALVAGERAPGFELCDAAGERHTLESVAGPCGLLVVFGCNHCPFVVHLAAALGEFAREARAQGVGTVVINSNDLERYPEDSAEKMGVFAREHGWDFPYLIDETQQVAKAYAAACTPDFYLLDGGLNLYYAGQFDASRPGRGVADGGDLRRALAGMLAGAEPAGGYPSSGCNIKWKPGNEPAWFG